MKFVAAGGYRDQTFWPETIPIARRPMPWAAAVQRFVDRTGIVGPRLWSGGKYPEGQGDYPVAGISWHEASAYARWIGKNLPTRNQWWRAAVGDTRRIFPWELDVETAEIRANFRTVTRLFIPVGLTTRLNLLRSAFDNGKGPTMKEFLELRGPQPPTASVSDLASFRALQTWDAQQYGFRMPEAEFRQTWESTSDGRPARARDFPGSSAFMMIMTATKRYTDIPVPALVIFAIPHVR